MGIACDPVRIGDGNGVLSHINAIRLAPTVPWEPPPTLRRGSFGGKFPPTVPPKAPPIYGGVETPLIYRVSFNSLYILIIPFLHDINLV